MGGFTAPGRGPVGKREGGEWEWPRILIAAERAGVTQERLWRLTPRELDVALRSATAQRREESEERRQLAIVSGWVAAYCARTKRLPRLERLLRKTRERKPQSLEEQVRVLEFITAMWKAEPTPPSRNGR